MITKRFALRDCDRSWGNCSAFNCFVFIRYPFEGSALAEKAIKGVRADEAAASCEEDFHTKPEDFPVLFIERVDNVKNFEALKAFWIGGDDIFDMVRLKCGG